MAQPYTPTSHFLAVANVDLEVHVAMHFWTIVIGDVAEQEEEDGLPTVMGW